MPQTARVRLDLRADADFKIKVPISRKIAVQGDDVTYRVEADALTGYVDQEAVDVTGLHEGVGYEFSKNPMVGDDSTNLTIDTTNAPLGTNYFWVGPVTETSEYSWLYVDNADRLYDWGDYCGIPDGIPNRTEVYTTLSSSSTASQITSAISACPSGQVVALGAGTFPAGTINFARKKNITLRGQGAGVTILTASSGGDAIRGDGSTFPYGGSTVGSPPSGSIALSSGYIAGSQQITLSSSPGSTYVVGNLIQISQFDDHVLVWNRTGQWHGNWSLTHSARITAVSGNTVSFTPPIPYSYSAAQSPRVVAIQVGPSACGIENLTINCNGGNGVYLDASDRCWLKKVELRNGGADYGHLYLRSTVQFEVNRCYFHDSYGWPNAREAYGIYLWYGNSGAKIEDNIFYHTAMGVLNTSSSACYYGYNYAWSLHSAAATNYLCPAYHCNHGAHGIMDLWEGNIGGKFTNDGYHGSTSHQVLFRNHIHGLNPTYLNHRYMINLARASYYHSLVGNVIGDSSWNIQGYEVPTSSQLNSYVYKLGWPDSDSWGLSDPTDFPSPWEWSDTVDLNVAATILRHGNYDHYNHAVVWDAGISGRDIPPSLFYDSKPPFFGSLAWPPVDPSGPTTGDNPAKVRWDTYSVSGTLSDLFADQA